MAAQHPKTEAYVSIVHFESWVLARKASSGLNKPFTHQVVNFKSDPNCRC